MLDIKLIRENPEKINELLKRRNPNLSIDEVIEIDQKRRNVQTKADELRNMRKVESQKIGEMKKNGQNTDAVQEEVKKIGTAIKELEEFEAELDEKQRMLLLSIPNTPDETTPIGSDDSENVVIKTFGEPTKANFENLSEAQLFSKNALWKVFNRRNYTNSIINGIQADAYLVEQDNTRADIIAHKCDCFLAKHLFVEFYKFN